MQKIITNRITGWQVLNPAKPVTIRDNKGRLFYTTEGFTPRIKDFNLPPGEYNIDSGNVRPLPKPVPVELSKMPPIQRRKNGFPGNFKIVFRNNPNKCSVIWPLKTIVFDPMFKEKPIFVTMFVLYHEYGHRFYVTEKYCDLYAANMMKKKGYNTSQIGMAQLKTLGSVDSLPSNHPLVKRKNFLISQLAKCKH